MLSSFAAYMARSVKPGTVASYIAAVRNLHLENGMADPTANTQFLPRVMRGIKRALGTASTRTRLPLTNSLIRKVVDQLLTDPSIPPQDRKMLQAAVLLAFHGFLRCAEFVANEHGPFDRRFDANCESVSILYRDGRPTMQFHVKRSKTDPYAKGMTIHIGPTVSPYCPVLAMVEYLSRSRPPPTQPLFQFVSGTPLSRSLLTSKVRSLLLAAGVPNAQDYSGHSFRIGAATTAAAAGLPDWQIRAMGRWQSDCVLRYIRTNASELLAVATALYNSPI